MHPTGSFIRSAIEDIRMLLNEATLDGKYDDQYIVRTALGQAMATLVSRVNTGSDKRILVNLQMDLTEGMEFFVIPPHFQQVQRIFKLDEDGNLEWDWKPRGEFHPLGSGWALDGNCIRFNPYIQRDETVYLQAIPSGFINMHYAETGTTASTANQTSLTLAGSPMIGLRGRDENEYLGAVLRVLDGGTSGVFSERVISAYAASTGIVTSRNSFNVVDNDPVRYEVIPAGSGPFWPAAATLAAMRIGTGRKISQSHLAMLMNQHRSDMKTLRDTLFQMQGRVPKFMDRNTIDNMDRTFSFEKEGEWRL